MMHILDKFKANKKPMKGQLVCYFPLRKHNDVFEAAIIHDRMYIQQDSEIDLIRVKEKESTQIIFKASCYNCGTEMFRKEGKTKTEYFFECPSCKNVTAITFESIMKKIDAKTKQEMLQAIKEQQEQKTKEKAEEIEEEATEEAVEEEAKDLDISKIVEEETGKSKF